MERERERPKGSFQLTIDPLTYAAKVSSQGKTATSTSSKTEVPVANRKDPDRVYSGGINEFIGLPYRAQGRGIAGVGCSSLSGLHLGKPLPSRASPLAA